MNIIVFCLTGHGWNVQSNTLEANTLTITPQM